MRISLLTAAGLTAAALLLASPAAFAQQAPTAPDPAAPGNPTPLTTDALTRTGPLLKLGTGLFDGSGYGGFRGLSLPLVLGVEQQLTPGWTATLNGSSLWNIGERRIGFSTNREGLKLEQLGIDAGIRHYYNQEKRHAKGRRTGPYEGPYVALQLNNYFRRDLPYNFNRRSFEYDYSSLTGRWGIQRQLGSRGLLDAYIGAGVANSRAYRYNPASAPTQSRALGIGLELGVKISLIHK
ncbi:hypothetical protein D0N36_04190 [Hymenobacter lapidiphilus]|uniref:hypothetical protein n=1 Tax=Hymenobacter sp. CCM 8763 TaxID=2303334 RepID=UPI000E34257D|nr:hypothetical protein [Hymenobacter sp. CCM 8763]RFP66225.1 hypothetical protein D0N36_04190 [Hymenobacter sp. CCM 8763]